MGNSQRIVEGMLNSAKGKPGRKAKDPSELLRKQVIDTQSQVILSRAPNYFEAFSQARYLVQSQATLMDRIARTEAKLAKLLALSDFYARPDTDQTLKSVLAATRATSEFVERKLQALATPHDVLSANIEALAKEADAVFTRQNAPTLPSIDGSEESEENEG